jgi:hypothetical protein
VRPGLNFLIIGGGILAAGLIIAAVSTFSVTRQFLEGSTVIADTSLEPNLSVASEIIGLPSGQQLLLSLSGNPSDVPLQAQITGPDGNTLALYNITSTPFTRTTTTKLSGNHTLEIKNVGSHTVTINGALLNSPIGPQEDGSGVSVEDNPSVQSLITYGIAILVGIVLIIAGIVLLIIGAIKFARGRRSAPQPSTTPQ